MPLITNNYHCKIKFQSKSRHISSFSSYNTSHVHASEMIRTVTISIILGARKGRRITHIYTHIKFQMLHGILPTRVRIIYYFYTKKKSQFHRKCKKALTSSPRFDSCWHLIQKAYYLGYNMGFFFLILIKILK